MTDIEILLFAAKAAGLKHVDYDGINYDGSLGIQLVDGIGRYTDSWNPLEDDGDALRLRNRINAAVVDEGGHVFVSVSRYPFATVAIRQHYEADTPTGNASSQAVDAAVRRAIVRAAAEIGLRMEKESK